MCLCTLDSNPLSHGLASNSSNCDWKEHKVLVDDYWMTKQNLDYNQFGDQQEEIHVAQFKLPHVLKGCLSYTRLWGILGSRKGSEGKYQPTQFATQSVRACSVNFSKSVFQILLL